MLSDDLLTDTVCLVILCLPELTVEIERNIREN